MNDNNNNKDKYKNILRTFINTVLIIIAIRLMIKNNIIRIKKERR